VNTPTVVRPELNIAKYANIFFPASCSSTILSTRKLTWIDKLNDGTEVKRTLRISPSEGFKAPSQSTYIILLALFQCWQQSHLKDGSCIVSYRSILRFIEISPGSENIKRVKENLLSLRETSFYWEKSFINSTGLREDFVSFNIISKLECRTKSLLKHDFTSRIVFKFDENIQRNLELNKTKPLRLDILKSIKSSYARALYTKLDLLMSSQLTNRIIQRCHYQRLSRKLFKEDLGVSLDKKYRLACRRKDKLEAIVKQIDGKEISKQNAKLKISIKRSKDETDWKLDVSLIGSKQSKSNKLRVINKPDIVCCLMEDIELGLKTSDFHTNEELYLKICKSYSQELIHQALSEFKGDIGDNARSKGAAFVAILRRLVAQKRLIWIK